MTPDGRYFVVRGRLWRMASPGLNEAERTDLVGRLMRARRAVRDAKRSAYVDAEANAHRPWTRSSGARREWAGMVGRRLAGSQPVHGKNTTYADWYAKIGR